MRTVFFGILTLAGMALPLKAVEFDIYGTVYPSIFWSKTERFYDDTVALEIDTIFTTNDTTLDTTSVDIDSDSIPLYYCTLWPYAKMGFKFNADKIGICVEIGLGHLGAYESMINSVGVPVLVVRENMVMHLRKFYAEWFITDWMTLLIGQNDGPACFYTSNQALLGGNSFANTGALWTGRNAMFQLSFGTNLASGELESGFLWEAKAAAIKVDSVAVYVQGKESTFSESKFPKFEGSFGLHYENDFFATGCELAGGYQQYTLTAQHKDVLKDKGNKVPVNCYVLGADAKVKLGPVIAAYNFAWGQNLGAYGVYIGNPFVWRGTGRSDVVDIFYPKHEVVLDTNGIPTDDYELQNGKAMEMCAILNVKPLDWLSFEGGYGYIHAEHGYAKYDSLWNNTHAYYGHVQFKIAEILSVTPEFGQYLYGHKAGYGRFTYWGFELAVDF